MSDIHIEIVEKIEAILIEYGVIPESNEYTFEAVSTFINNIHDEELKKVIKRNLEKMKFMRIINPIIVEKGE